MINKELLDILVCPDCKATVHEEADYIICKSCRKKYPIRDGIPIMLIEEAELNEES